MSKNKHSRNKHNNKDGHAKRQPGTGLPEMVTGPIFLTSKGMGFVKGTDIPEDVKIPEYALNTALHGDIVEVALSPKKPGERVKGKVKKIIQRAKTQFVGTIQSEGKDKFFVPDDAKIYANFQLVKDEELGKTNKGQKVVIEMKDWNNPNENPIAKVTKILGYKGEHETEMLAVIYEKGFSPTIPENIEKEAHKIKDAAPADFEAEVKKRISVPNGPPSSWDFRNTTTFTIDPFDAKDFDDALSFKDLGDGTYEVGVHIADVTHYVQEGSAIDREAVQRGTSIYLVDRTIPMLPEVLSNDLCSLNPKTDKLAFSAIFILNDKCEVLERWFGETIINSNKRFTYRTAQDNLDNQEGEFFKELTILNDMALLKRKRRTRNGAISFGSTEVQFKLDAKGFPIEVYEKEML
ncbi:ribonuclease R, partial [Patescibacteria group bacterium]|nr:ribonuclease R [Patescibacteria group bacterium]